MEKRCHLHLKNAPKNMQYCTFVCLFVCFALVSLQLERILVLRCCYIYLDNLSFPQSFPLRDGHVGSLSAYICTET